MTILAVQADTSQADTSQADIQLKTQPPVTLQSTPSDPTINSTLIQVYPTVTTEVDTSVMKNLTWNNGSLVFGLSMVVDNDTCFGTNCPKQGLKKLSTTSYKIPRLLPLNWDKDQQCAHEEPAHIGPFAVPSEHDLVQTIRRMLMRSFASYRRKANYFLEDIERASISAVEYEKDCAKNTSDYRHCVQRVSDQTTNVTTHFLDVLTQMQEDVEFLYQNITCNTTAPNQEAIKLLELIASEEVAIGFSLPGFLRLLNSCSMHCNKGTENKVTPSQSQRKMDGDFAIQHFLSRMNYQKIFRRNNAKG